MTYNVQPLRSQQEINDFLFCLRRNKNAKRDVFLFLIGINSGLRMSDIVKLKKQDILSAKNPRIVELILKQPAGPDPGVHHRPGAGRLFISQHQRWPFGSQYGVPDVPEGRSPAWKGRYRHTHATEDLWLPLLQEDQRCGYPDGNFRPQQ